MGKEKTETLYSGTTQYNYSLYRKYQKTQTKEEAYKAWVTPALFIAVGVVMLIARITSGGIALMGFALLYITASYGAKNLRTYIAYRRYKSFWGQNNEITLAEDRAEIKNEHKKKTLYYENVKSITEDDTYIYLTLRKDIVLILENDKVDQALRTALNEL